jgi:hypothetical protein
VCLAWQEIPVGRVVWIPTGGGTARTCFASAKRQYDLEMPSGASSLTSHDRRKREMLNTACEESRGAGR